LNNALKHAQARNIQIIIRCLPRRLDLEVHDDGKGFDPKNTPVNHFGVNIMNDRAMILAGHLDVASAPGKGTVITLQFLPQKSRQSARETH
jgi:nitrate/nitrite-specific signal transduction histidine kinase